MNYHLYWFYLLSVMILIGIIKEHNLFNNFYLETYKLTNSKKFMIMIYSIFGCLIPIPGRIITTTVLFDSLKYQNKRNRWDLGIFNYMITHHYYFWSPLEATVIIPMTLLGLTYIEFISLIWLLPTIYVTLVLLNTRRIKEFEIELNDNNSKWYYPIPLFISILSLFFNVQPYIIFPITTLYYLYITKTYNLRKILSYIKWKLILVLIVISIISTMVKKSNYMDLLDNQHYIYLLTISWLITFMTGSSAKFIGITVILTQIFGIEKFAILFLFEYTAYYLSPFHHCVIMTKNFFEIPIFYLYKNLVIFVLLFSAIFILLNKFI